MRPKQLKIPIEWTQEAPIWHEGVYLFPKNLLCSVEKWEKRGEVKIEYCSGNGDWVIERAKKEPDIIWVAVEKRFDRVQKIWSKMKNEKLENVKIVCAEAFSFGEKCLPSGYATEVFINFPDPWPKRRHAKFRLIQAPFIIEVERIVTEKGKATFVTDDSAYAMQMIAELKKRNQWRSVFFPDDYKATWEEYGNSWFKELWDTHQRKTYYIQFEKVKI